MWCRRSAFDLNGKRGAPGRWRGLAPASPYLKAPRRPSPATKSERGAVPPRGRLDSLVILLAAPFLGNSVLFWTMVFTAIASVAAAAAVPAGAIDHDVARGLLPGDAAHTGRPSAWGVLLHSRPLM